MLQKKKEFDDFTFMNFLKYNFLASLYKKNAGVQSFKKNFELIKEMNSLETFLGCEN